MNRSLTGRLATQSLYKRITASNAPSIRAFSQTCRQQNDTPPPPPPKPKSQNFLDNLYGPGSPSIPKVKAVEENTMASLTQSSVFSALGKSGVDTNILSDTSSTAAAAEEHEYEPYHLHVVATKHNTHITCTRPNREPIISLSCGCLGYKKSRRAGFDSAYSLTKYVIERLIHNGWPMKMKKLEVVLRGFGQGRDAAIKVLMSPEGKVLRDKIVRVADGTKLKFGGTRSKKPRRL